MESQTESSTSPRGMTTFYLIWFGQVVSIIGSRLTGFAMGVWVYEETGNATPFVLIALFSSLAPVVFSALAGAIADRWNRRLIMIASDIGSALTTMVVFLLFSTGQLEVWHLYITSTMAEIFNTFQRPAYSASLSMLVPKEQLGRANGLVLTGQTFGGIAAPMIAGVLFGIIGVNGIIAIDFVTFFFAVGVLLFVRIPQPKAMVSDDADGKTSLSEEIKFGFAYLRTRQGLMGLAIFIALINVFITSVTALSTPMILAFTNPAVMGIIRSVSSIGMLLGGLTISTWGGPKGNHKMKIMFICALVSGVGLVVRGLQPDAWIVGAGGFLFLFPIPIINTLLRTIVQIKVPPEIQGRIFSILLMLARIGGPVGYLISAPLSDGVFEPAMKTGGALAHSLGPIFGVGAGRGIGVMFVIAGFMLWVVTGIMYTYPRLRNIETELPDADLEIAAVPAPSGAGR